MSTDLDAVKTFYDPHPGLAGALIPIPASVKEVANELDGRRMSLRKAVAKIQAVTTGSVEVVKKHNFISLNLTDGDLGHQFRVIRFR